jgi:flagellar biosynthesis/type III secretory pathway M-ring protein FliF/YscJ
VNVPNCCFADVEIEDVALSWQKMSAATKDGVVIFGVLMLVSLFLVIWAAFIRRRRRRKRAHHYPRPRPEVATAESRSESQEQVSENSNQTRRRSRRRRREHRPKNPTLAETGGLPPIRDDAGESAE